ncbi:Rrf2 family transcriptional regulator [Escherichia coli]|uniref:Rrf2 family transcriptional regulator n=1 Tax=Escherichia coli TaxID=562 RepID=UPI00208DC16D|nr:Rrf2 family transcriptional regulator [Escherichia coli]
MLTEGYDIMCQRKISDEQLITEHNNGLTYKQIAEKYGMSKRNVERLGAKLAKRGLISTRRAPGFGVNGESLLVDKDGNVIMRWIKTARDRDEMERLMQAACDAFTEDMPRAEAVPVPEIDFQKSLALYPVFDLHIGALAHKAECGESYDTGIAERVLNDFFDYAVGAAPMSEKAVLLLGGDILHTDGLLPVTPSSNHVLDCDSRYAKLVYVAIRSVRRAVGKMLLNHKYVEIQTLSGNHDQSGMIWLRAALAAFYEDEPRVTVDVSPAIVHHTQYGKTFLAYHHGHTIKKTENLLSACVSDWREDFGKSSAVYAHCGHWHHQRLIESSLGVVEYHGTLAGKDAYSTNGGWRSRRLAAVIIYSPDHGEIGRFVYYPEYSIL